ncbi:MAG TPA: VOC family protein [Streptosporangiaceae bacterium]|nr:VOC family protein [Streptosporangiaceae bacterium]
MTDPGSSASDSVLPILSVFLACEAPYETASFFVETLGWRLAFATPRDGDDKMACVALGDAEVMLGTADEQYLPAASREHRGAGVTVYLKVDGIDGIWARHQAAGVTTTELSARPWGERAFVAVIAGYRFLIAEEAPT